MKENYNSRDRKIYSDYSVYSTEELAEAIKSEKYYTEVLEIIQDILDERMNKIQPHVEEDEQIQMDSVQESLNYIHLRANKKIVEENNCKICNGNFSLFDELIKCEKCNNYYHKACWGKNNGCNQPECISDKETKPCPFCGKEIKQTAIKCKHCVQYLDKSIEAQIGPQENAGGAITSLVLAIIGLFIFGFVLGWIAIGQANRALKSIEENPNLKGRGIANAGKVLGIIDIIGWGIALIIRFSG